MTISLFTYAAVRIIHMETFGFDSSSGAVIEILINMETEKVRSAARRSHAVFAA